MYFVWIATATYSAEGDWCVLLSGVGLNEGDGVSSLAKTWDWWSGASKIDFCEPIARRFLQGGWARCGVMIKIWYGFWLGEGRWVLVAVCRRKICCSVSAKGKVISKDNAIAQCLTVGIFANKNDLLKKSFWLHIESNELSAKAAAHTRQSARHCRTTQYLDAELCEVTRRCGGWWHTYVFFKKSMWCS